MLERTTGRTQLLVNAFTTAKLRYQQAKRRNVRARESGEVTEHVGGNFSGAGLASPRARDMMARGLCRVARPDFNRQVSQGGATARTAACAAQHVGRLRGPVFCHTCRVGCVLVVEGKAAGAQLQRQCSNEGLGGRSLLGIAGYPHSATRHPRPRCMCDRCAVACLLGATGCGLDQEGDVFGFDVSRKHVRLPSAQSFDNTVRPTS
jgi:hypothetical protein